MEDDRIRFRTRNGEHTDVTPRQFVARWLLHMLPSGFHKIRHFGLYSSTGARTTLLKAAALLGKPKPSEPREPVPWEELAEQLLGRHPLTCPECGTPGMTIVELPRPQRRRSVARSVAVLDSS